MRQARRQIESADDDVVEAVHAKESALEALASDGNLGAWKRACDLWCAAWMPGAPPRQLYHAMLDLCLGRASHARDIERWRDRTLAVAADVGCFHWPLEFPEVFLDAGGRPSPSGGFDAVIGNPPWEMLRGDRSRETSARAEGAALVAFALSPVAALFLAGRERLPIALAAGLIAALVFVRHRDNILRLARGEETKIGAKGGGSPPSTA